LSDSDGAKSPLRITPAFFYLLLTLVDGERHGYAMAQEVRERSEGGIKLGPGSLYWSLGRLAEVGLIEEVPGGSTLAPGEERRRYYQLTEPGRAVLKREAETLSKVVKFARAKRVV
jgi:DNA-binding PadR family transcriptional regulator